MPKLFSKDYQPARKNPPFSATNQPAGRGRKPKLGSIPDGARKKIVTALWHALALPDQATAADYLKRTAEELPEYGYMIQVYAKGMMGKNGIAYVADLLDRIIGKPKQATELLVGAKERTAINITLGDPDAVAGLRHALATGAQPAPPEGEDPDEE